MRYPKNWPEGVPKPPPLPKRWFEDEQWFMQHSSELAQQYSDQWVAVFDKQVIAAGKNASEVLRVAKEKTGGREVVIDLVSPTLKIYSPQHCLPRRP
jgi:hypothetical protein